VAARHHGLDVGRTGEGMEMAPVNRRSAEEIMDVLRSGLASRYVVFLFHAMRLLITAS